MLGPFSLEKFLEPFERTDFPKQRFFHVIKKSKGEMKSIFEAKKNEIFHLMFMEGFLRK